MNESIKIDINSGSKSVLKLGLVLRAGAVLFTLVSLAIFGIQFFDDFITITLICFAMALGLFIVFFKIMNAAFFKEYLIVTKNGLTVFQKNLSGVKKYPVELSEIIYFGFSNQQYTKHVMHNPIVDFTGLATQEKEMQYIIDEGNIKIETENEIIKFGKNVPSWDVEELVTEVENFTGRKFASPKQEPSIENPFVEEKPEVDVFAAIAEGIELDPQESQPENQTEDTPEEISDPNSKRYSYQCYEGELIIEQKEDEPDADDKAFLNGRLAPTGKYKIGEKKFVFVSNGIVYAVRD
jgi:hypothetical protein